MRRSLLRRMKTRWEEEEKHTECTECVCVCVNLNWTDNKWTMSLIRYEKVWGRYSRVKTNWRSLEFSYSSCWTISRKVCPHSSRRTAAGSSPESRPRPPWGWRGPVSVTTRRWRSEVAWWRSSGRWRSPSAWSWSRSRRERHRTRTARSLKTDMKIKVILFSDF